MDVFSFLQAVETNNLTFLDEVLQNHPEIINSGNVFCMFHLVNSREVISSLLRYCGRKILDHFKEENKSIIISAIESGKSIEIIKEIILFDKEVVNYQALHGDTPLMYVIKVTKDIHMMKLLLNYTDINQCDEMGFSPLHYATELEAVKLLLENGANVDTRARSGTTPLLFAIEARRGANIIHELIKNGADVNLCNDRNKTPLHLALCCKREEDVIWEIFNKTENVNKEDGNGHTPLCYALNDMIITYSPKKYTKDFIFELISKGAIVNSFVFMHALKNCSNSEIIREFVNTRIVDVKCIDSDGNGVLHYAHDLNLIKLFLRRGVFVNHKNASGFTPLMAVLYRNGNIRVMESLLLWGADPNCLDFYFQKKFLIRDDVLNVLVLFGANISLKNKVIKIILCKIFDKVSRKLTSLVSIRRCNYCILRHLFVSNENIVIPNGLMVNDTVDKFFKTYYSELNKMKEINIINNLSFYDFCMKHYKSSRSYADVSECKFINNDYEKVKAMFPIMYDVIIVKIEINIRLRKRIKLLKLLYNVSVVGSVQPNVSSPKAVGDNPVDILLNSDSVELVNDCLYQIGRYLCEGELKCLLTAAILE